MAVVSVVKRCMHCGCENELDVAELGEVLGYPDLDSRPSVLDNQMTEDELKSAEDQIQKITDGKIAEIDTILAEKEKEVMSV